MQQIQQQQQSQQHAGSSTVHRPLQVVAALRWGGALGARAAGIPHNPRPVSNLVVSVSVAQEVPHSMGGILELEGAGTKADVTHG